MIEASKSIDLNPPVDPLRPVFEAVSAATDALGKLVALKRTAAELATPIRHGLLDQYDTEERLIDLAHSQGLVDEFTLGTLEVAIHGAISTPALPIENATPRDDWEPPGEPLGNQPVALLKTVTPPQWPAEPPPRVSWVAHNLVPRGDVSSLGGDGGSGKTMAALQLGIATARGAQDWLGHVVDPGAALFISAEEPEDEIRRRVSRIGARQGFDLSELADLHFWFPSDIGGCTLATPATAG